MTVAMSAAQRKQGQFEVIAGKSLLAFRRHQEGTKQSSAGSALPGFRPSMKSPSVACSSCFNNQGMQENQQIDFLSDGGEDVRNVQLYLNPQAEHLLDWFHLTMRLTVLNQTAKGLPERIGEGEDQMPLRPGVSRTLWSGSSGTCGTATCFRLFTSADRRNGSGGAAFESQDETTRKLLKAVEEFSTYVERNGEFIPNYGERYRNGERISTGFVESAINQVVSKRMVKKQQMEWTQRGAHLLLQIRTRVLDEEWEDVFRCRLSDLKTPCVAGPTPDLLTLSNQLPQFMRLFDPPGRGLQRRIDSVDVIDRPAVLVPVSGRFQRRARGFL